MALLAWMLIANLRYRRDLLRLAEQDSLTGLPNRRRTAEKATNALAWATAYIDARRQSRRPASANSERGHPRCATFLQLQ